MQQSNVKKKWQMSGSEHSLLFAAEFWGLSTEPSTSASGKESSALLRPTYPNSLSWHLLTVFPVPVFAIGVNIIILLTEINRDQTTVHDDLTTNVILYQETRRRYRPAPRRCSIEMLLAL